MEVAQRKMWQNGKAKEITFIVTQDCQLACKYCYQVGKNSSERMSFDTAKKAVDYILSEEGNPYLLMDTESIIFEFIGGEPLIEVELIDRICDYIEKKMTNLNHHWLKSYMFSLTTNGINYHSAKVQQFLKKHHAHLSITITIDGTKEKHDLNRVWKNDLTKGSYDDVVKNIPLWLEQFPNAATKVTLSSNDLPYISESVMHLYSLGIKDIHINCVFENVWKDGDVEVFESQLKKLADEIIDKKLFKDHYCSFFQPTIGYPLDSTKDTNNWCGAGRMIGIDAKGVFYPCIRFAKYSLREKAPLSIGNIVSGLNPDRIRAFTALDRCIQSPKECIECPVASGCAWCQGENYDSADTPTINQRSTSICEMHKARVRANRYYWGKLEQLFGIEKYRGREVDNSCKLQKVASKIKNLTIILDDTSAPVCKYYAANERNLMPLEILSKIIEKTRDEKISLMVAYPKYELPNSYVELLNSITHRKIVFSSYNDKADAYVITNWERIEHTEASNRFLSVISSKLDFFKNVEKLIPLFQRTRRINILFSDGDNFTREEASQYQEALALINNVIVQEWEKGHKVKSNLLTDSLLLKEMNNCNAGDDSFTMAPNGKYYVCPAFYYVNSNDDCGNIEDGITLKNRQLYQLDHSKVCRICKNKHCIRCIFDNVNGTGEVNTPTFGQCLKSNVEKLASKQLYRELTIKTK